MERQAEGYSLTQQILERFRSASIVQVDDYRHIFNRPRQRFQQQKQRMKLILAVKKEGFIYPGSENAQDFGSPNFFYTTPILNCLYNCDYCFLQGMYASANLVVFVNQEDLLSAATRTTQNPPVKGSPVVLAISYNTDLLALESWLPLCRLWIEHARKTPDLLVEIRTKSANFRAIRDLQPPPNVVLAWTLSPSAVATRYEHSAPPLEARIRAARKALDAGWQVRLCFDPLLPFGDTQAVYGAFLQQVFEALPADRIRDVTTGVFRMSGAYFKTIQKVRSDCDLYYRPYDHQHGIVKLPGQEEDALMNWFEGQLLQHIESDRLDIWRG